VKVQKRKLAYSAKIGLASAFRDGNLTQEISSKLFIEKNAPKFPIPKTISHDEINQFWFIEKYVNESRKFSNQKKASIFLSAYAVDYYSPFFFPMTLERFLSKHHITLDLIHGIFQEAGEPIAALDNLGTLAAAYAHGDLSPINLIIDEQGRLYVVDWEHFGVDSVAFDLVKLLRIDPRLALTVLTNISKCGPGCSIPALQQFKIALGVQLILARRDYKNILNYHTRHGGSDKSKTQLLLLNSEKDSLFFLSKLNEFIP
jgi:tRNA A-37 threonylcarbamoyl transferase component Bud32